MTYTTESIRKKFLEFFKNKNHTIYPSSSLVIENDPSILFTNAGMNQFKNFFLGYEIPENKKISSIQNCIRAGGKKNDLKNVGKTSRHHTFFEMLGNFSFGDYFKKKSIIYAWELLTSKKWFNIDENKLLVTIYEEDIESYNIWRKIIGLSENKIIKTPNKKNKSENFWKMGKYGPCGPCTEIFYDYKKNIKTNYLKKNKILQKKYIELWNIVFIQYNKLINGKYLKLKIPSVDTGMGLERISSVLQKVKSNYDIDIFKNIIKNIKKLNNVKQNNKKSIQVIADHIRSSSFLIASNIFPSNEYRGYVLRKIIRRAIRHGYSIGIKECFFYKLVPVLIKYMGSSGKLLKNNEKKIIKTLKIEELKFSKTLKNGLKLLKNEIKQIKNNKLDGNFVFYLYDTIGFPIDLTKDFCKEKNIKIDIETFKDEINKRKKISKEQKFNKNNKKIFISIKKKTKFKGYNFYQYKSYIKSIYKNYKLTTKINNFEKGKIILDKTPFYPESGGQIGDSGFIQSKNGIFKVSSTKKYGNFIIHTGKLISGKIKIKDKVVSKINFKKRKLIEKNHTATHLLNSALKKVLGKNVIQKGSLVNDKKIRFDFSYHKNLKVNELDEVENLVNKFIHKNKIVKIFFTNFKKAKKKKINFLSHKIYKKNVRVVSIKPFSCELCTGTHVKKTGKIFIFKIISEKSISSGIRRIEAITYKKAISFIKKQENNLEKIKKIVKNKNLNLILKIKKIVQNNKKIKKENKKILKKYILLKSKKILKKKYEINNKKIIFSTLYDESNFTILKIIDEIQKKNNSVIIILINISKIINLKIKISKNLISFFQANKILLLIFKKINGKGGGNKYISEGIIKYYKSKKKIIKKIKKIIFSIIK
ncbi:MAG: alanine--tRNA ligase [Buchnera aphidicola (Periphyllus acericola)]|uniref:alanine--tRNA ligase n=1 Tax=Buchnera aphidicola TaxID=9 RepID=UPI0030CFFFDF|nr:alanine--tRNA ligase [Buchnera aphidicola (Periphyllus acericola)]